MNIWEKHFWCSNQKSSGTEDGEEVYDRERFTFFKSTIKYVMTSEGLFAFFGCSSISGKDERSCGCKQEDKQKEK